jgi:putative spermidine/putrescine transport system permease protein
MLSSVPVLAVLVTLGSFVLVPVAILLLYSFSGQWNYPSLVPDRFTTEWYSYLFKYEQGLSSLFLSTHLAILSTFVTATIGVPVGYVLARYRFQGRTLMEMVFLAKNTVPVIVVGVGTASVFVRWGLYDTYAGILLAHVVGALPIMVWNSSAAFQSIDPALEEAARDAGAGFSRVFIEISLPLAKRGILAACILAFLASMDEFTITFLISGANYTTLPLRLYSTLQQGYIEPASASAMILLLPSVLFLIISMKYLDLSDVSAGVRKGA